MNLVRATRLTRRESHHGGPPKRMPHKCDICVMPYDTLGPALPIKVRAIPIDDSELFRAFYKRTESEVGQIDFMLAESQLIDAQREWVFGW